VTMSATHAPALQTSGLQQSVLTAHGAHAPLLHACPLQSSHETQVVGVAHAGVDDGVRIASS